MKRFIKDYIHKRINYTLGGRPLHFFSSQELFSSFDLDRGSKLLLYSLGEKVFTNHTGGVLDAGCGIGTLGVCLKSQRPELQVDFTDRDALALAFAEYNAMANNLSGSLFTGSLGINQLPDKKYDLVVSNIPAKAGGPVIEQMIKGYSAVLTEKGLATIVIVHNLAEFAEGVILKNKGRLLHKHSTADYTVFHYNGLRSEKIDTSLKPYIRGECAFRAHDMDMRMRTVYGLPDFEHPGYAVKLGIHLLKKCNVHGSILVYNPGQGHIPLFLLSAPGQKADSVYMAGRDLLGLLVSQLNIMENLKCEIRIRHIPYLRFLEQNFDFIIVNYEKEAVSSSHVLILEDLTRLLKSGGEAIITGGSTFLFRFNSLHHDFTLVEDIKRKGCRGCRFKKK
jgi:16S rRNA G1207 methylase RsmC